MESKMRRSKGELECRHSSLTHEIKVAIGWARDLKNRWLMREKGSPGGHIPEYTVWDGPPPEGSPTL